MGSVRTSLIAVLLIAAIFAGSSALRLNTRRAAVARMLANSTIASIVNGIRTGRFTCEDVITEQLRRIDAYNSQLKAFIFVNRENALSEARRKDRRRVADSPLHCVPVAVKDNIDVRGIPTTSGARALKSMVAVADSVVVARIKRQGGIIIGKTNMAEMSDSGTKSHSTLGGVCANPWDTRRSCLGSSGGSGASVASGLAVIGVGTDTEGSVIGPCTASGLLCLRPTQDGDFEAVKTGVYPAFSRQDTVGIMAKSSQDYLTAHDAIYGAHYSTSIGHATCLKGVNIRFLDNFYENIPLPIGNYEPDPDLVRYHNLAAQRFAALGACIERYKSSLQELGAKFGAIFQATATKGACSNSCMRSSLDYYLSRYAATGPFRKASDLLAVLPGFPASYQDKLQFTLRQKDSDVCGAAACDPYNAGRATVTNILSDLFGDAHVLAVPFAPKLPQLNTDEPSVVDQIGPALNPYTGWPSVALPVGFSKPSGPEQPQGLPVSVVLLSRAHQEKLLLRVASAYLNRHAEIRTPQVAPAL